MSSVQGVLIDLWLGVAVHLWQTTLVLVPIFLIGRLMRSAPGRLLNLLWWAGILKLCLPLAVFGRAGERIVGPLLGAIGVSWATRQPPWLETVTVILDPTRAETAVPVAANAIVITGLTVITIAWAAGAAWILARGVRGVVLASGREAAPIQVSDPDIRGKVAAAARRAGVPTGRVRIARDSTTPGVGGLLRPRILLPERLITVLSAEEVTALLIHEEEHCRRRDLARGLILWCAMAAFFFYPLLWPLVRRLNATAEIACDEAVIRAGVAPRACARALARALSLGLLPATSPAAINPGRSSLLRERFDRLTRSRRYVAMHRYRFAVAAGVVLVLAASFLPPLAPVAGSDPEVEEVMPRIIPEHMVKPVYPEDARKAGVEGMVLLDVLVKVDGTAGEITVKEGVADYPSLAESAVAAVKKWRFEPGTRDGKPVDMQVVIPLKYKLHDKKDKSEKTSEDPSGESK